MVPQINDKNIFVYWTGHANDYILLMRALMILHSNNGQNYKFFIITQKNIRKFISDTIPRCFLRLKPAHQADWVRVKIIHKYGGIWLDSDMIMIDTKQLDEMFDIIYNSKYKGFVVNEGTLIYNGVFGSQANTPFLSKLLLDINYILGKKGHRIFWTEIGNHLFTPLFNSELGAEYLKLNGENTIYPVVFSDMESIICSNIFETYKEIEKPWQPVLVITRTGFINKMMTNKSYLDILAMKYPLNYFINKSIANQPNNINSEQLFSEFPTNTRIGEILNHLLNLSRQ